MKTIIFTTCVFASAFLLVLGLIHGNPLMNFGGACLLSGCGFWLGAEL